MRLAFVIAIVVGAVLAVVPLAASEPTASKAAERLIVITKPVMTTASLSSLRAGLTKAEAVAAALTKVGLPRLAVLAGQTPAQFHAYLSTHDSGVAAGLRKLPVVRRLTEKIITNLERRRAQYEAATKLPGLGLSLKESVWLTVVLGVLLAIAGVVGLVHPRRSIVLAIGIVGLVLVAAPLALGNVGKASDTDAFLNSLRPFSVQRVQGRREALAIVETVFNGFQAGVIPQVAALGKTTPVRVRADLGSADLELTASSLRQFRAVVSQYRPLVAASAVFQKLLVKADALSAQASVWLLMGAGISLLLASAIGIAASAIASRSRRL